MGDTSGRTPSPDPELGPLWSVAAWIAAVAVVAAVLAIWFAT